MPALPLLNSTSPLVYYLASCVMHIPTMKYFDYLCAVTYSQKSIISGNFLPNSAFTAICHPNVYSSTDDPAKEACTLFAKQRNFVGFRNCFPNIRKASLRLTFRISVPVKVAQGEAGWPHRALLPYGLEFLTHDRSHDSIHDPLSSAMTIDSYPIWHRSGMHTTGAKRTCIIVFTSCFPTTSHTSGHGFLLNICSYKGCSIRIMLYTVITNNVVWNTSTTVTASTGACARRYRQCWLQLRRHVFITFRFLRLFAVRLVVTSIRAQVRGTGDTMSLVFKYLLSGLEW